MPQNGEVPIYANPANLPPAITEVAEMLGMNQVRLAILAVVAQYPEGVQSGFIIEELELQSRTVTRHLAQLVDEGWLITDEPAGQRAGKRLTYRTNTGKIRSGLHSIADLIAPEEAADDGR